MGPVLKEVEDSIFRLNQIYRKILVLTGVNPDRFRDYNLAKVYPEAISAMDLESKRLYRIVDDIVAITGEKSDRAAVAQTLAVQLEQFVENNDRITESFTNFKDNITSLGTAMQNMSESKLDVDLIMITGEDAGIPSVNENFFTGALHEIRSCASSFFVDYNSLGDKYASTDDVLDIWITTGRDQSTVLKTMVDDTFTAKTGIKVNVKLVQADAIMTAVVAGNGPDIVLSVSGWFAVNYAMRNAVEDLTQFPDFEEVVKPFYPSILEPLTYNNGIRTGVYGMPETQNFNLLFYRTDIMEELGLEIPNTWEELIAELPTIQGNSLTVALPYPDIALADISVLDSMIFQNGGSIYDADAKHTVIDSEAGVAAFKQYTSLYNDYGLPTVFDFVSRFRSGEMPMGIASYATYNTLMVSAPEIRGLWDFTLIPGTRQEDGSIDRTAQTDGLCCMMIATDDEHVKQNAWEFIKWWVSDEAQVRFGREMESVLGASARYQTANRDALRQLAWSNSQLKILEEQMSHTRGFPEIAGGYSTTRHITNAIRRVINTKEDPRETQLNYARTINEEIRIKRREFNLPVD
jgi:ABC-type glycerol-3-phosphate transport system substrate-binding protein